MFVNFVTKIIPVCIINSSHKLKGGRPFFANKFGNQIQVWKHAKYLVKQIGPLTPQQQQQTFGLRNFHHHHDTLDKSKAIYNGAKTVLEKIDRMTNWPKGGFMSENLR